MSDRVEREAQVWQSLRSLVRDQFDYKRAVAEALGMSFFRAKALRRLAAGALSMRDLAVVLSTDASYTTIVVDDLEARGYVVRSPHPDDRRVKVVTATAEGRRAARRAEKILESPPPPLHGLSDDDLATLQRLLGQLTDAPVEPPPTRPARASH